jgi:3-methyladenine DNA glycosylase Tag
LGKIVPNQPKLFSFVVNKNFKVKLSFQKHEFGNYDWKLLLKETPKVKLTSTSRFEFNRRCTLVETSDRSMRFLLNPFKGGLGGVTKSTKVYGGT